jgi:hypothetical protein
MFFMGRISRSKLRSGRSAEGGEFSRQAKIWPEEQSDTTLRATAKISRFFVELEQSFGRLGNNPLTSRATVLDEHWRRAALQVLSEAGNAYTARAFWGVLDADLKICEMQNAGRAKKAGSAEPQHTALSLALVEVAQMAASQFETRYDLKFDPATAEQSKSEMNAIFRNQIYAQLNTAYHHQTQQRGKSMSSSARFLASRQMHFKGGREG